MTAERVEDARTDTQTSGGGGTSGRRRKYSAGKGILGEPSGGKSRTLGCRSQLDGFSSRQQIMKSNTKARKIVHLLFLALMVDKSNDFACLRIAALSKALISGMNLFV